MAYIDPRTWTDGELVTASIMNAHVRDVLRNTLQLIARKTANENLASNTTLQNDDHLLVPVLASEVWLLKWVITHSGGATGAPNIKIAFTLPAGASMNMSTFFFNSSAVASILSWQTSGTSVSALSPASANPATTVIEGHVIVGGTAGNVQLQWAQVSSSAENETVYMHSSVWGKKV